MKQLLSIAIFVLLLISCNSSNNPEGGFKKTASGFQYKIIKSARPGDSIHRRDVVKVHLYQYIDDSLLNTTVGKMPQYVVIDNSLRPFDYTELLPQMQVNDSAVCIFATSDIINRAEKGASIPDYLKKGKQIKVFFKIVASFAEEAEAMADMERTQSSLVGYTKEDEGVGFKRAATSFDSLIQSLPQKPTKLASGVYVQITEKGSGGKIKQGQEVGVIFQGKLMNGTVFDASTAENPFLMHAGTREAVEGFDEAISSLSIGDKATLYIPAPLAFGAKRAGEYIPAFSNLIFTVEIINPLEKKK
jgi:FKBP-type peptidyl-prolyl cis-trans isomerase FkpA